MNRHRWITVGLAATLTVLVVAAVAVAVDGNSAGSAGSVSVTSPASSGPFRTASSVPAALAKRPIPQFDLRDARGSRFSSRSLRGRAYAITFLYVHCVDVCPLIGSEIHDALQKLGTQAKNLPIIAISVDPNGDTGAAVRKWLSEHQEPTSFHYLIGTQERLKPIWKAFYVSAQTPGDPISSHTAVIWLINQRGRLAALVSAGVPINTTNLAHDFRVLLKQQ
jgi:protein SCO1/2